MRQAAVLVLAASMVVLAGLPVRALGAPSVDWAKMEQALDDKEYLPAALGKQLQSLVEQNPNNLRARYLLGKYFARQGFESLAREQFEQSLKLNHQYLPALVEQALLLLRSGQSAQGVVEAERCLQSRQLTAAQALELAKALELSGMVDEAQKLYARAGQSGRLGTGAALAQSYNRRGLYQQARLAARQDLAIDADFVPANLELANALVGLNQVGASLVPLTRLFDQHPLNGEIAERLAKSFYHQGKYGPALRPALYALGTAVDRSLRMRPAKQLLQDLLPKIPDAEAAETVRQVSLQLDKTRYGAFFHLALGDVYDKLHQPQAARQQFQQGLALNPNFGRGWFRLGKVEEQYYGRYDQALSLYQRAAELEPYDREINLRYRGLQERMSNSKQDLTWQLKNWLARNANEEGSR